MINLQGMDFSFLVKIWPDVSTLGIYSQLAELVDAWLSGKLHEILTDAIIQRSSRDSGYCWFESSRACWKLYVSLFPCGAAVAQTTVNRRVTRSSRVRGAKL